jgi:hypothetical protein
MARARLRGVGPEENVKLITAPTFLAGGSEHSKQRQPSVLMSVLPEKCLILWSCKGKCPEGPQTVAIRR